MSLAATMWVACSPSSTEKAAETTGYDATFVVEAEAFADLQMLRYEVPGFNQLSLQQKQLAYYLYEAALSGRDIIYDQKSKYGLLVRKTIEAIYENYKGDKNDASWKQFEEYCGRVWFSNGNYHHYSNEKFIPACSFDYFQNLVRTTPNNALPLNQGETVDAFINRIQPILFDANFMPKCVDLRAGVDNIANSANNYYEGVSQKEVEAFYALKDTKGNAPSWGLNSKVVKENGQLVERIWKVGGMYDKSIAQIVYWLEKATGVAENDQQKKSLQLLVDFYKTGDLKIFDDYSIEWVHDTASSIDVVNGFIEVYLDA
ncbi:MAG: dihydrofolate reductase, partial [Chitinophagia bacterium]|nr:dihydrofolate reductase [Chitinophagia bacterium]